MKKIILTTLSLILALVIPMQVIAMGAEQRRILDSGSRFYDVDLCFAGSQGISASTATGEGKVFVLGDSIAEGLLPLLPQTLTTEGGWQVSGDALQGRSLSQGVAIAQSNPPALSEASQVLVVLGTNNLTNSDNAEQINNMVEAVKASSPNSKVYWLQINVTREDLTTGAAEFNQLLNSASGINIISNTATSLSDGVHPDDYTELSKSIGSQISAGGSPTGNQGSVLMSDCVCPVTSSAELSGSDNAERVWNFFKGKGLSAIHIAGIMGNVYQESKFDPELAQSGERRRDPENITGPVGGGNGYGLIQWDSGSRLPGYLKQAGIGGEAYELGTQLDLVWWHMTTETPTSRRNFLPTYIQSSNIDEATRLYEVWMTGAGRPMMDTRIKAANDYFNLYANSTGGGSGAPIISSSTGSCSDVASSGQDTKYVDGFTVYSQNDPDWKDLAYDSSTIGESGCGPAAMAMIITNLTGQKVTPVETAKYAAEQNLYFPGAGSSWAIGPVLAEKWGLKAVNIGVNPEKIAQTLQAGGLVITAGKGAKPFTEGGHFIVIRGITAEGKYKIGDSGHSDTSDKEWDANQILAAMEGRDGSVYAITK